MIDIARGKRNGDSGRRRQMQPEWTNQPRAIERQRRQTNAETDQQRQQQQQHQCWDSRKLSNTGRVVFEFRCSVEVHSWSSRRQPKRKRLRLGEHSPQG
eukprot:6768427-Alexandrium_andersonii.AAC.1